MQNYINSGDWGHKHNFKIKTEEKPLKKFGETKLVSHHISR